VLVESHAGDIARPGTSPINLRTISILFLKSAKPGDYDQQNLIMDTSEQILLDFIARLKHDSQNLHHNSELKWLRGFNEGLCQYDSGGPLFINYYGYNLLLTLPGNADLCWDSAKERFNVSPES
jgi:hypothetical protein